LSVIRIYDGEESDLWKYWQNFDPGSAGPYVPQTHKPTPGDEPPSWRNVDSVYIDDVPFVPAIWEEVYFN
jgi:hypothetical protein